MRQQYSRHHACDTDDRKLQGQIATILDLPTDTEPVSIIPLGFPAENPEEKSLRPLEEMIRHV